MVWNPHLIILMICIVGENTLHGAKILVHLPTLGHSHFKPFEPLFLELVNRGHNVTVIGAFPPTHPMENYHHFQVAGDIYIRSIGMANLRRQGRLENYVYLHDIIQNFTIDMAKEPHTRRLLQSKEKYDLVMIELYHFDAFFLLAEALDAPIIGLSFQPLIPVYNWVVKNPWTFSYVSNLYLPFTDTMNFMERLVNSVFGVFTILFYNLISLPTYQEEINLLTMSAGETKAPKIEDVTRNLSLILLESHFSAGYTRPYLPNVVEVSGIHILPVKPLPEDVENFINSSTNDIIYVSLGTLIDPDHIREIGIKFIEVLETLPYNVLWKWNPKLLSRIPKNALVREWLPQSDILRHPKCKLFISHGGYHSIVETINAGVPILCLPFFTDQYHNSAIVRKYGIGIEASADSSQNELLLAINELFNNPRYREKSKKQSEIFKDRPMSPLESAVYWTEYVIRHKGAPHLKSAAIELSWYQYLLLDVILFLLVLSFAVVYTILKFGKYIYNKCIYSKSVSKKVKTT